MIESRLAAGAATEDANSNMAIDREHIERLHAEAKRVRKNFRYIAQDLKRSPENIDLLRQRDHLRKRYDEIQAMLMQAREAESVREQETSERPPEPEVDMSIFEPKPFEVPAPVHIKQRSVSVRGGSQLTFRNIRIAVAAALLLVIIPFLYLYFLRNMRFYEVPSRSMEPTLLVGDRIVAVQPGQYERGDIVVLSDLASPGDFLVKRLVALPGDTVEVVNGSLFINNQPIEEPYIQERMDYSIPPTMVPAGEVYLLGDNRNESEDSHIWKTGRQLTDLQGRVHFIYSPSSRRGAVQDQRVAFKDVKAPSL